ncbi:glycoside hydrolase family 78 protein [Wenyingzhuangia sp. IMCC45467]
MKKIIYTSLVTLLLFSCGGGGGSEDIEPQEPENTAPTIPVLKVPADNTLCVDNTVDFEWNRATDAEGDAISYQVQIAKDNQFTDVVKSEMVSSLNEAFTLSKGTAYYWRVKAVDNNNESSEYSTVNSFYTEAVAITNHLPFLAQAVQPKEDSFQDGPTVRLRWNAKDVDVNDVLTYDVYFGTDATSLDKIKENTTATFADTPTLETSTTYFWKVDVMDDKGGKTNGSVWSFTTN